MKDTCILVTTFLRDELLFRCIKSIRKYYPKIPIFIGDNGKPTEEKRTFAAAHGCTYIELPFDLGVAGVRNESIAKIPKRYKYIVIAEDDILFTKQTILANWRKVLDADPGVGLVGGLLKFALGKEQHYEGTTYIEGDTKYTKKVADPEWKKAEKVNYFLCDLVLNVFMMRRELWDDVKWDARFKTAYEHMDFFLSLKYDLVNGKVVPKKKIWKVAYTPDVILQHRHEDMTAEYALYRSRPVGHALFADKWGLKRSFSEFDSRNPIIFADYAKFKYTTKDIILDKAIRILEGLGIRWWLDGGTCLGAIREDDFIAWDTDVDIGIAPGGHLKWEEIQGAFTDAGFELYKQWMHDGQTTELSFNYEAVKIDIFFWFEKGDFYWFGAYSPNRKYKWEKPDFVPRPLPAKLFQGLKEIFFRGKRCFVPNPPEDYLIAQYGKDWRTPKRDYCYWRDNLAADPGFLKEKKTVFIAGVWDRIDSEALDILERARAIGTRLVVGVLSDDAAATATTKKIPAYNQRERVIKALSIVDEVMEIKTGQAAREFQKLNFVPDYYVTRDTVADEATIKYLGFLGKKIIPLTDICPASSSWGLSDVESEREIDMTEPIAIGIKTFFREEALFRTVKAIQAHCPFPYKLYVADDSKISDRKQHFYQELEKEGHVIFRLPFDCGISVGRNQIVKSAQERYILMLDDDIELTDRESLKNMRSVLDDRPEVGVVSGLLYLENGDFYANEKYVKGLSLLVKDRILFREPAPRHLFSVNGSMFLYADQVINFFMARREVFDEVLWDARIKVEYEHMAFFLDLQKTRWKAAVCLGAKAIHQTTELDGLYNQYRRTAPSQYFLQKYNLSRIINRFQ